MKDIKNLARHVFQQYSHLSRSAKIGLLGTATLGIIFVIFNFKNNSIGSTNLDAEYKSVLEQSIKLQLTNDEDIVESTSLFNKLGGFKSSKERAMKVCEELKKGATKDRVNSDKLREVNETLKLLNPDNSFFKPDSLTSQSDLEEIQKQSKYITGIYIAEVFNAQDIYCPETQKEFSINN